MTDTDKLKRLAEAAHPHWYDVDIMLGGNSLSTGAVGPYIASFRPQDILALIADNERLKADNRKAFERFVDVCVQRDEAVALLVPLANMATVCGKGGDDSVYVGQSGIHLTFGDFRRAFSCLARIDAANKPVA